MYNSVAQVYIDEQGEFIICYGIRFIFNTAMFLVQCEDEQSSEMYIFQNPDDLWEYAGKL